MPDTAALDPSIRGVLKRPFPEQVKFFRGKMGNLIPTEKWTDVWKSAHDRGFMVAGAAKADLLADLAEAVDAAIAEGEGLGQFRKRFREIVAKNGWTGWTGEGTKAGRAWRTRVIYNTNTSTSYAAGRLAQLKDEGFKWWVYRHSDSVIYPRPLHVAWDGLIVPAADAWWHTHYPPNGWGCRCYVLGARGPAGAKRLGGDPYKEIDPQWEDIDVKTGEPVGIDRGWGYMPGQTSDLLEQVAQKEQALQEKLAKALQLERLEYQAQQALKLVAKEYGEEMLVRSQAKLDAAIAAWKYQEASAGNMGKWYAQAAKKVTDPELLDQMAAALKAAYSEKVALANYKKAVIAGKKVKKDWYTAFEAADQATKNKILFEIGEAKDKQAQAQAATAAAQALEPQAEVIPAKATDLVDQDFSRWQQFGPQEGSNPGGWFRAEDGSEWYVKWPRSEAIARNEVVTAKLYELAGIEVPHYEVGYMNGRFTVASRNVPALRIDRAALTTTQVDGVHEGFAVDAWLANWDVVGLDYDNLKVGPGAVAGSQRAVRVDTGGGLLYRAQGLPKGAAFGRSVGEFDTLRSMTVNDRAASVFGRITEPEIRASAARVLMIPDEQIRKTVLAYGHGDLAARSDLAEILIARKADIDRRYPGTLAAIQKEIAGAEALVRQELDLELDQLGEKFLTAIRGIAKQAEIERGPMSMLRDVDLARTAEAAAGLEALFEKYKTLWDADTSAAISRHFGPWMALLLDATAPGVGKKAVWRTTEKFDWYKGPQSFAAGAVKIEPKAWMFGGKRAMRTEEEADAILRIVAFLRAAFGTAEQYIPRYAGAKVFDNMPKGHVKAIVRWTGDGYYVTKPILLKTATQAQIDYADLTHEGLVAAPKKYEGEIGRGMSYDARLCNEQYVAQHVAAKDSGAILESVVPASWKRGTKGAWGNYVQLHIKKSTQGVHVNPISLHHGSNEDEVMMPRFRYRVVKYEQVGTVHHFWLEEA